MSCGQSFSRIYHIGNHYVYCGCCPTRTSSITVGCTLILFFCCIVLCFGIMLTRGFHNIFIVHDKHINVSYTMAGLCGVHFFSMVCVESMVLMLYGKNQGFIGHTIFDCLHMVMFMSINLDKTINDFKARGKEIDTPLNSFMDSIANLKVNSEKRS